MQEPFDGIIAASKRNFMLHVYGLLLRNCVLHKNLIAFAYGLYVDRSTYCTQNSANDNPLRTNLLRNFDEQNVNIKLTL